MAVVSVAAYHLSVLGGLFFLLPLEAVRRRHGLTPFLGVMAAVLVGITAVAAAFKGFEHQAWSALDTVMLAPAFVFSLGWAFIVALERYGWRMLYRVTLVTVITGILAFPTLGILLHSESFNREVQTAFATVWKTVFETPGLKIPGLMGQLDPKQFFDLLKASFLGSFLLVTFLFWCFTWRVGKVFAAGDTATGARSFAVPPLGVGLFLVFWGLLFAQALLARAGNVQDWGLLGDALLNAGMIALAVHLWAGWGIFLVLLDRWKLPRVFRVLVMIILVIMGILPGVGQVIVVVGLSVLAVMELWVNFRNRREEVEL